MVANPSGERRWNEMRVVDREPMLEILTGTRHGFDVVALQDQFVLLRGRVDAGDAVRHDHSSDDLLAEKVSNLHDSVVLAGHNVDGKVSVDGTHLVQVALGDADNHVLNVRAHGADGGELFADAEPLLHANLLLADHLNVKLLLELSGQHATRALDAHLAVLHRDLDCTERIRLESQLDRCC